MKRLVLTLVAIASITVAKAQLYVDYGGARNIFINADSSDTQKNPLDFLSYDSKTAAVSLNALKLSDDLSLTDGGDWLIGGTVTATAASTDITQMFKSAPTFKVNVLANDTAHSKGQKASDFLSSWTTKVGLAYSTYSIENPTTKATATTSHYEPSVSETYAISLNAVNAFAFTAGYDKEDNYSTLPQTTNPAGKKVGLGTYQEFSAYPAEILYVREIPLNGFLETLACAAANANANNGTVDALLSPYVKLTPRNSGSPSSGFGVNLALKSFVPFSDPKHPEKDKITIPWSFYVEWDKKFGTTTYVTTGGVSAIFSL